MNCNSNPRSQHYLPVAYLQQFSADKTTKATRKSRIWRFDGKESRLVAADSQCCKNYFYSRSQAAAAEMTFQPAEGCFSEYVRAIKAGKPSTKTQSFGLIGIMFDLHLRNAAYENQTGKNNLHAYGLRLDGLKKLLVGEKENEPTDDEALKHLERRWRVRVFSASPGNEFITSDNPSILMRNLSYAILPLTPYHVAIAYDCHQIEAAGKQTTSQDEELLNELQLSNATQSVYSSAPLNREQQEYVAKWLNRKSRMGGKTNETSWTVSMRTLAPNVKFSFVEANQLKSTYLTA
jgi:hypothetical protein